MYMRALRRAPLPTKVATASSLAVAGDVAAQSTTHDLAAGQWDARRTLGMAVFGAAYSGVFQHHLFAWYARTWPVLGMPRATQLRSTAMTVLAHQFGTYPFLYIPTFFLVTEMVRGRSVTDARARLEACFAPTYTVGLFVWTPALFIQFLYVPLPLQVLWISTCSLCWNTFLSWRAL